jgi:hypothetical protein
LTPKREKSSNRPLIRHASPATAPARGGAGLCAENENGIKKYLKTLPVAGRPMVHCQVVWRAYRVAILKKPSKQGWRDRLQIDEATALQARDGARLAARDAARGQYVAAAVVAAIADAAFAATLNALDIAVPEKLVRDVTFTTATGQRVTVPKIGAKAGTGKIAATA